MCHLILVCKYRKNLLTIYGDEIKNIFFDISNEKNFTIIEVEVDKNHIHTLIQYHPAQSILDIARHLRQIATYRIWRQNNNHVYMQKHFWKERTFWSDGYFACSIGNVSKDIIEKYTRTRIRLTSTSLKA